MENSPDNMSVLLQFAKFSKGFRISDFEEFIEESIGVENFDFFGRLAYPNQWQIRLTDPKVREELLRKGRTRIKNRSCWIYPLNQQEIRGIVHWLPNSVTNDQLKVELQRYGEVLFVESGERTVNKREVESDLRYYGLILPYGTIKEDLPHFWRINGYLCLLVVRGREPACYHCKEVGHRRMECPKYKAKLTSYCCREPNTAPPRLRPRGKRHLKTDTEVQAETGGNNVSSTQDIVSSDWEIPVAESITESHSSALEELENVNESQQEKATGSTKKELEESYIFPQRDIHSSAATLSETQLKSVREIIQQEKIKAKKVLEQTLKEFEKKVALAITKGAVSTQTRDQRRNMTTEVTSRNLDQDMSNEELETQRMEIYTTEESVPIEVYKKNSNANTDIKKIIMPETRSDLQSISQVEVVASKASENIHKESERKPNYPEPTVKCSTSNADTSSSEILFDELYFAEGLETCEKSPEENVRLEISNEEPERQIMDIGTEEETKFIEDVEKGSNASTGMKETTATETLSDLQTISQVNVGIAETDEEIGKNSEEKQNYLQPTESAATYSANNADTNSGFLFSEETKKAASESFINPFKELAEFSEGQQSLEKSSEVPALDTGVKTEDDERDLLDFLEATKTIAMKYPLEIEKEIKSHLSTQKSGEDIHTEAKLTEDICFSERVLAKTIEECKGKLERKFKSLKEEVKKASEQFAIHTESADKNQTIRRIANIATEPKTVSELEAVDMMEVVEIESSERASGLEYTQSSVETVQTEFEHITHAHGDIEATEKGDIYTHGEEIRNVPTIEKTLSATKDIESNVSKAVQEDIEKLQTNVKSIFALAQAETKLPPEMNNILKELESKVMKEIEETKNKWKAGI